jgi:hypothetical protein
LIAAAAAVLCLVCSCDTANGDAVERAASAVKPKVNVNFILKGCVYKLEGRKEKTRKWVLRGKSKLCF